MGEAMKDQMDFKTAMRFCADNPAGKNVKAAMRKGADFIVWYDANSTRGGAERTLLRVDFKPKAWRKVCAKP